MTSSASSSDVANYAMNTTTTTEQSPGTSSSSTISSNTGWKDRPKGLFIIFFGVLCVTPDAVLTRFLSQGGRTSPWTIIGWKMVFSMWTTGPFAIYEAGGIQPLWNSILRDRFGRYYYAVCILLGSAIDIGFTFSFVYTTAANALLLISLNPLWCAVIGRLFLGDTLPTSTIVELVLAMGCMILIFVPDIIDNSNESDEDDNDTTTTPSSSWGGNICALCTGLVLATFISIVRKSGQSSQKIHLTGAATLGGALSVIISIVVKKGDVLPPPYWHGEPQPQNNNNNDDDDDDDDGHRKLWHFFGASIAQGLAVGILRITTSVAPKLVTGAEIGLVLLLETLIGPLWVFLAYGEAPSRWTIIGGSLLLVVLAVHESQPLFQKAHRVIAKQMPCIRTNYPQRPVTDSSEEE